MKLLKNTSISTLLLVLLALTLSVGPLMAQSDEKSDRKPVDISSRLLRPVQVGDSSVMAMVGEVMLFHNGTLITCDSLVRYSANRVECFDNVVINKDSIYVYGDRAVYSGETNTAEIFSPLIKKIMAKIPQASAMLTTGISFTSFHAGSEASPQITANTAQAHMFLRCIREESLENELAQIKKIAARYGVEIESVLRDYCEPTDFTSRPYQILEELIHENFPDVITAPFLLTAGTDARRFTGLADSILRFAPIDLNKQQFSSIHSKNENITIQNIGQCVLFYKDFIRKF